MDTWGKSPIEFEFSPPVPSFQTTVFDNGACSTTTWNSHPEASSSKEGMFPACDSVSRKSSHQRKKPDNHIPRPPNAFILFRASFIKSQHVSSSVETNHSTLSKIIGLTWTHLPEPERQVWHAKARAALDDHKKRFPSYAFKPAAKGSKAKSTGAVDSDSPVPSTPAKRRRLVAAPSSPELTLFATPETPSTFQRATIKRIPRASPSTAAPKPRKRTASNRAPVPKDVARCEKIAQLLVAGTRGTALDDAIAEFDKTHVPVYETTFLEVHMPSDYEKSAVVEEVKVEEEAGGVQFFQESGLTYTHSSKVDSPRAKKLRSSSAPRASSSKLRLKPSRHSSPAVVSSPAPCFEQSPYSPMYDEDVFYSPQPAEVYSAYNDQQQAQCYSTYQQHVYDDTTNQYSNQSSATVESFDFSAFDFRNTTTSAPPSFSPIDFNNTTSTTDINAAFEPLPSFANFVETTSGYAEPRRLSINTDFSQWSQPTEYNFDCSSSPPSSSPAFDYTSSPSSFGGSSPHSSMPATPLMGPFDFGVAPLMVATPSSADSWAENTFSSLSEYQSPSEYLYVPETTGYCGGGGAEGLESSYGYDFGASESQRKDAEFALFMGDPTPFSS